MGGALVKKGGFELFSLTNELLSAGCRHIHTQVHFWYTSEDTQDYLVMLQVCKFVKRHDHVNRSIVLGTGSSAVLVNTLHNPYHQILNKSKFLFFQTTEQP